MTNSSIYLSPAEPLMNMETCRQAAAELYNSVKKATQLYTMVSAVIHFSTYIYTVSQVWSHRRLFIKILQDKCSNLQPWTSKPSWIWNLVVLCLLSPCVCLCMCLLVGVCVCWNRWAMLEIWALSSRRWSVSWWSRCSWHALSWRLCRDSLQSQRRL